MARREKFYTVEENNRDFNKTFVITEMSAFDAESFAIRAGLALLKNNPNIQDEFMDKIKDRTISFEDVSFYGFGLFSSINYDDLQILLDDLMACVQIIVDKKSGIRRSIELEDIEEVGTIITLRKMVLGLHVNFLQAEDTQNMAT